MATILVFSPEYERCRRQRATLLDLELDVRYRGSVLIDRHGVVWRGRGRALRGKPPHWTSLPVYVEELRESKIYHTHSPGAPRRTTLFFSLFYVFWIMCDSPVPPHTTPTPAHASLVSLPLGYHGRHGLRARAGRD